VCLSGAGWTDLKTRKRREKGRWQQKREEGGGETIVMESRLGWEAAGLSSAHWPQGHIHPAEGAALLRPQGQQRA
jgi:hypothetical protein